MHTWNILSPKKKQVPNPIGTFPHPHHPAHLVVHPHWEFPSVSLPAPALSSRVVPTLPTALSSPATRPSCSPEGPSRRWRPPRSCRRLCGKDFLGGKKGGRENKHTPNNQTHIWFVWGLEGFLGWGKILNCVFYIWISEQGRREKRQVEMVTFISRTMVFGFVSLLEGMLEAGIVRRCWVKDRAGSLQECSIIFVSSKKSPFFYKTAQPKWKERCWIQKHESGFRY